MSYINLRKVAAYVMNIEEQKKYVQEAIASAESYIDIWEKAYPEDKRPREAIEAAKACLANPTEATRKASYAAYADAHSAAYGIYEGRDDVEFKRTPASDAAARAADAAYAAYDTATDRAKEALELDAKKASATYINLRKIAIAGENQVDWDAIEARDEARQSLFIILGHLLKTFNLKEYSVVSAYLTGRSYLSRELSEIAKNLIKKLKPVCDEMMVDLTKACSEQGGGNLDENIEKQIEEKYKDKILLEIKKASASYINLRKIAAIVPRTYTIGDPHDKFSSEYIISFTMAKKESPEDVGVMLLRVFARPQKTGLNTVEAVVKEWIDKNFPERHYPGNKYIPAVEILSGPNSINRIKFPIGGKK